MWISTTSLHLFIPSFLPIHRPIGSRAITVRCPTSILSVIYRSFVTVCLIYTVAVAIYISIYIYAATATCERGRMETNIERAMHTAADAIRPQDSVCSY